MEKTEAISAPTALFAPTQQLANGTTAARAIAAALPTLRSSPLSRLSDAVTTERGEAVAGREAVACFFVVAANGRATAADWERDCILVSTQTGAVGCTVRPAAD